MMPISQNQKFPEEWKMPASICPPTSVFKPNQPTFTKVNNTENRNAPPTP